MTVIELFDDVQIENAIAGFMLKPDKIIFIGFKKTMTSNRRQALNRFFRMQGLDVEIEYEKVGRYDFDAIVTSLNAILDNNSDCIFDITGGKEMVVAAMGDVALERKIPIVQFDVRSGRMYPVKNCDNIQMPEERRLSIPEVVAMNGGLVVESETRQEWRMDAEFRKDLETMWQICRENCARWNKQSIVLKALEHMGTIDESLCVTVDMQKAKTLMANVFISEEVFGALLDKRLIVDCNMDFENILVFRYKNNQVYQCIKKAGSILELYAYMLLMEIVREEPECYTDVDVGVFLDWDGEISDSPVPKVETRNEVDLILMRGINPIFISCKNGEVHKDALYELDTVAERYGGKYARKILLTTYINNDCASKRYILKRAGDMGIKVIDGIDRLSREQLVKALKDVI